MQGKWIVAMIAGMAAIAGVAMYYLQLYHFYDEVSAEDLQIKLTAIHSGAPEPIPVNDLEAIDATSSPIRFRACFTTPLSIPMMTETFELHGHPEPLTAPDWFGCFDAQALGAALEEGTAFAFMGERDIVYGIDRVVAFTDDGRGFAWQQINPCGEKLFDGEALPEGCPPPPDDASY